MTTRVLIGIPCFQSADFQVMEDYMRLVFHIGRRCPEIDLLLGIIGKSEQFRARNTIVKAAIQSGCEFLWMLDDDHIIDYEQGDQPTERYDILRKLIYRMREKPRAGVVGALYWQRGGEYLPVMMQEQASGIPHFLHPMEVSGQMQQVDVTGGGCMLIRMEVFDRIAEPWFAPEHDWGTDIQLCRQVRAAGWEVWCDTSIEIGHLRSEREVISSKSIKRGFVPIGTGADSDNRLLQPEMQVVSQQQDGEKPGDPDAGGGVQEDSGRPRWVSGKVSPVPDGGAVVRSAPAGSGGDGAGAVCR
jgi:hypothetical protein